MIKEDFKYYLRLHFHWITANIIYISEMKLRNGLGLYINLNKIAD